MYQKKTISGKGTREKAKSQNKVKTNISMHIKLGIHESLQIYCCKYQGSTALFKVLKYKIIFVTPCEFFLLFFIWVKYNT